MSVLTKKMSDENSELDEMYFPSELCSELESTETVSNLSFSPSRNQDDRIPSFDSSTTLNVIQNLFRREMGFGCLKPSRDSFLKSYHLSNIFPHQVLCSHVFMGMSKCGRFLITYTMTTDQDDEEWYATVYKYRLHWWNFKPGGLARKIAEVSLFGNHKIVDPLQMYICQWPKDYEKILVYGLMKECCSMDTSGSNNRHAFVTVTALPSLNDCQDCRVVASSYMLDDIAASWDTCLRFSCLKHGYTVHTSFDVVVPYPEFSPKISLKCNDYAVFNANNFLYALKITLGNCDKKVIDDTEEMSYQMNLFEQCDEMNRVAEDNAASPCNHSVHVTPPNKALKLKEQIIQDFSEEINLGCVVSPRKSTEVYCHVEEFHPPDKSIGFNESPRESFDSPRACLKSGKEEPTSNHLTSPPLPTRVNLIKTGNAEQVFLECKTEARNGAEGKRDGQEENGVTRDCFRCPMSPNQVKRNREQRKTIALEKARNGDNYKSDNNNYSKKCCKSFFTRHKIQKTNFNFGIMIRSSLPFAKSIHKSTRSMSEGSGLDANRHIFRNSIESVDSPYEFVDDTQNEVEKLSQFRKKRLAEKKYEFQDFDSENIVPFSMVRQENILRSPKKLSDVENEVAERLSLNIELRFGDDGMSSSEMSEAILRSPSPRYPMDLSASVPSSPRSPLIVEILSSPTQYDGVLRPFNRNTNGSALLSPMTKYLCSPPATAQKVTGKSSARDSWKSKGCDEVKTVKTCQTYNNIKNPNSHLDARVILENGILINDISEWYFKEEVYTEEMNIYKNLFRNLSKFHGEAVRFERRFVDVDDELVSVITDIEDDDTSAVTGYHTALNVEVHGAGYSQLQMISNSKAEKVAAPCVIVDQQSLDIEAICHSVATTLCQVSSKTFTFCNDYDIEILDVCPRTGDVLVLLMMRIEGAEGIRDEVSDLEQYEASVTLVWNLHSGTYKVFMVVPPQKVNWAWNSKGVWNPAKEGSKRFRMRLPADVTLCEPAVRVCGNNSTLRGVSLARIEDLQNGIQFIL